MEPAIAWAIGVGSCIFGLGTISAIASRNQRRARLHRERSAQRTSAQEPTTNRVRHTTAISMASEGIGNTTTTGTRIGTETEEMNFAATSSPTR
jgi:hypothetical protein